MLNFTGSTKKRVVNLGDRRGKSHSFLEQARLDRLERERSRTRDKNATIIQSYVKRHLELCSVANVVLSDWNASALRDSPPLWCARLSFLARFLPRERLEKILALIPAQIAGLAGQLDGYGVASVIRSLNVSYDRGASRSTLLQCYQLLLSTYSAPTNYPKALRGTTERVAGCATPETFEQALDMIFALCTTEVTHAFLNLLGSFLKSTLRLTALQLETLSQILKTPDTAAQLKLVLPVSRLRLLSVILRDSPNDYDVHAIILSSVDFTVSFSEHPGALHLNEEEFLPLKSLTLSIYVTHAFDHFRSSEAALGVNLLSQLLKVFPDTRTSLSMMMSIIPTLPLWMCQQLSSHHIYRLICEAELHEGIIPPAQLGLLKGQGQFMDILYAFQQILSSWLVVSNDTESFDPAKFALADIVEFSRFLKVFCLSAIFLQYSHSSLFLADLKEISITLLNQLHMKNLRLKFLTFEFWSLKKLKFEVGSMLSSIIDYEESRANLDEDQLSDEENETAERNAFSFYANRSSEVASKLEILSRIPYFVDFSDRVRVFQSLIEADKQKSTTESNYLFFSDALDSNKLSADIRREFLLEDAFENFHTAGEKFKNKLKVAFFNEHGPEAGIDGGGLTKEFLTAVVSEAFDPENELALFKESSVYELYPNEDIYLKMVQKIDLNEQKKRLMYTMFLGMILGKCLYEGVLIDVSFAPFFLYKWRSAQSELKNSVDDLVFLDPELYKNLNKLTELSESGLESLDLTFVVNEVIDGRSYSFNLQENGENTVVNISNRLSYIYKMAFFKLNQSLHIQTKHFMNGLFSLIKPTWLNMFDPIELQMLISGGHEIDLNDWKQNVQYNGYFDDDETINLFWEVVEEMSTLERCALIKFVTSVARAPLLGFGALSPKFGIGNAGSSDRLPTSSTCLNLLKLPDYRDKALIRQRLLYSINANSGFDLS